MCTEGYTASHRFWKRFIDRKGTESYPPDSTLQRSFTSTVLETGIREITLNIVGTFRGVNLSSGILQVASYNCGPRQKWGISRDL